MSFDGNYLTKKKQMCRLGESNNYCFHAHRGTALGFLPANLSKKMVLPFLNKMTVFAVPKCKVIK